jgi:hypothetical protein
MKRRSSLGVVPRTSSLHRTSVGKEVPMGQRGCARSPTLRCGCEQRHRPFGRVAVLIFSFPALPAVYRARAGALMNLFHFVRRNGRYLEYCIGCHTNKKGTDGTILYRSVVSSADTICVPPVQRAKLYTEATGLDFSSSSAGNTAGSADFCPHCLQRIDLLSSRDPISAKPSVLSRPISSSLRRTQTYGRNQHRLREGAHPRA